MRNLEAALAAGDGSGGRCLQRRTADGGATAADVGCSTMRLSSCSCWLGSRRCDAKRCILKSADIANPMRRKPAQDVVVRVSEKRNANGGVSAASSALPNHCICLHKRRC